MKPLHNFRVLDLTNVLAGPFCCHQLAHMGADVIKVEEPEAGDLARKLGADPELNENLMGVSFLAQNTGKRSITINLKSRGGKDVFRQLVRKSDALVENYRPGVMNRLGLGYEELRNENPALVYCAISGFGQDGPLRNLPAYDQIIQGMSGIMSITGNPDTAPLRVGFPVADTIGGLTAAFAVASALADRTEGRFIDVSMLEAVMATMGWIISNYLATGRHPEPMGNDNFTASPSGMFRTGEGFVNIAANKQEQFEALCRVVERPHLVDDPRFAERKARLENRAELTEILEDALSSKPAAVWLSELNAAGVPAGGILRVPQALAHPQISKRGLIGSFDDPSGAGREIRFARPGIKLDGIQIETQSPPPRLGEHTERILKEIGFSECDIKALRKEKAV